MERKSTIIRDVDNTHQLLNKENKEEELRNCAFYQIPLWMSCQVFSVTSFQLFKPLPCLSSV